ncbi:phosphoribosyltransferase [Nitzschia inconspicua]|uniref:Phosphoribosyltransferase n=1 Tax=Nitzschia inconspicua TaxID=303405 RepID=A0A9K3KS90_9STRA|nr:phosphoribosyltransferase [Nitzschia inconspicua]KAG7374847.1 phosphoribosyltransferase [Nitzschia inconspicua]
MTTSTPASALVKSPAEDGKVYYSYADIHESVSRLVPTLREEFQPDVMIAIGGGGFIPARMLRTELKAPILAISLELYDDATNTIRPKGVVCHQWFDENSEPGKLVQGGNVLIIDEVDDTRTTLQYAVELLLEKCQPKRVGVCVVHNKNKPKKGILSKDVAYYAAEEVEDHWLCYPWDAAEYGRSIVQHETLARQCSEESCGSSS